MNFTYTPIEKNDAIQLKIDLFFVVPFEYENLKREMNHLHVK